MRPLGLLSACLVLLIGFGLVACSPAPSDTAGGHGAKEDSSKWVPPATRPYKVVCTVGMVADIVRRVAGERATVVNIIGEGVDPHLYSPTSSDVNALLEADVVFYSGLVLEGKMGDVLEKVNQRGTRPVRPVTVNLPEQYLLTPPAFQGHPDPHVWMDASAWSQAVDEVARVLAIYDTTYAAEYAANATAYKLELDKLHAYAKARIATIPQDQRVMVTAHDAFSYFGRAYDIEVLGIQGISTESEAGLDDINRLVDLLVKRKVQAVFVESSVSEKNIKALIEGAKSRGHTIRIGGQLFSDAMGKTGSYEGTYIGMIDHNVTLITRSLGGEAPQGGMNGKLSNIP